MVISVVRNLNQTDTAKRMHVFFVHVLTDRAFKFADKEVSQKCNILLLLLLLFSFFLFDFVNVYKIRLMEILLLYTWIALPHMLSLVMAIRPVFQSYRQYARMLFFPFQGILMLTYINDPLRRSLWDAAFNGHPLLNGH